MKRETHARNASPRATKRETHVAHLRCATRRSLRRDDRNRVARRSAHDVRDRIAARASNFQFLVFPVNEGKTRRRVRGVCFSVRIGAGGSRPSRFDAPRFARRSRRSIQTPHATCARVTRARPRDAKKNLCEEIAQDARMASTRSSTPFDFTNRRRGRFAPEM
jgi:hypothetical protein